MVDTSGESEMEEDSAEVNSCKVSWMMNKGLGIGKKILVTGMVMSSAPLVLPPLVVISAIGFAFCVPSGVVLASYACTEKLMNKWLPYSTTPLLLENGAMLMSNCEETEQDEGQGTWVGGRIDIENEEGWDRGDIILEGGEMRIELLEKENDEIIEGVEYGQEGVKNAREYVTEDVGEIVEENGYEESVGESIDVEKKPILENTDGVKIKGLSEDYKDDTLLDENPVSEVYGLVSNVIEGDEETGVTPIEVATVVMEENVNQGRASDIAQEEELVEETKGLPEKIRDEGNVDNAMEKDDEEIGVAPIEVTTVVIEESEEDERVSEIAEEEDLVEETRGLLEKTRDEGNPNNVKVMERQYVGETGGGKEVRYHNIGGSVEEREIPVEGKIADGLEKPTHTMEVPKECEDMQECQEMKYVNNKNGVSEDVKAMDVGCVLEREKAEAEKPIWETKNHVNNILEAETRNLRLEVSSIEEDKQNPIINNEEIPRGRSEDNINDLDFQLIREKEIVISSNADAREIADVSGLDLFDEKNVSGQQYWHVSNETYEGGDEGADFAELPVSRSAHESTDAGISSGKDFITHSNGVLHDEAKIWAQIDAMRSIVGYKGTPHATCIKELKALYLFTGVEPPASFDDHPDLAQVNDKLRFLMSIIGVKVD